MLTLAQWIARLTKGYIKFTGKKPDKLSQLKIKFEAAQKVKDQSKVVPFKYKRSFKQEIDEMKPTTAEDLIKKGDWDPSGMAGGGIAGMLGEPTYADGGRIGLAGGKLAFDAARRKFLELIGAGAATGVAAKSGLFGLLKAGKPVTGALTSVPITQIKGMPDWYPALVNQIIKKGKEVPSGAERVIVHKSKLPGSKTDLYVTQELDTGNVLVDIGMGKHGFAEGHLGQPVRLEYRASEVIEPVINTKTKKVIHKGQKTKPEFTVEEAEFTGGHPENIKFEESTISKFGEHGSNFDEVEKFATGKIKKKTAKESIKAERAHWVPEGDMASGGRVPMFAGSIAKGGQQLGKFTKSDVLIQMFENTIKQSKSANTKKRFTNFIKEIKAKPELANDPEVWGFFTKGLPKNQRLVVHSDDTVDFWTQSDFGPHNIETTDKFMKKHPYFTREQAIKIQNMEPEDQILEMKRLETIRNRTTNATGGRVSLSAGGLAGMLGE